MWLDWIVMQCDAKSCVPDTELVQAVSVLEQTGCTLCPSASSAPASELWPRKSRHGCSQSAHGPNVSEPVQSLSSFQAPFETPVRHAYTQTLHLVQCRVLFCFWCLHICNLWSIWVEPWCVFFIGSLLVLCSWEHSNHTRVQAVTVWGRWSQSGSKRTVVRLDSSEKAIQPFNDPTAGTEPKMQCV